MFQTFSFYVQRNTVYFYEEVTVICRGVFQCYQTSTKREAAAFWAHEGRVRSHLRCRLELQKAEIQSRQSSIKAQFSHPAFMTVQERFPHLEQYKHWNANYVHETMVETTFVENRENQLWGTFHIWCPLKTSFRERKNKCKRRLMMCNSPVTSAWGDEGSTAVEFIRQSQYVFTVNSPFYTQKGCSPKSGVWEENDGGMGLRCRGACPQDLLSSYMSRDAWMSGSSISQTTLRGDTELRLKKWPAEKR